MKGRINALMIGVGGAFNVLSGVVPEAPTWMQKAGLEWFYRFMKEPKRLFKRYITTNPKFVWYLITGKD
jgi:N-acetylglucosaminyldiphosphoundecaprenol N-acetyl-beta-D-mannosaminyltransferase